MLTASACGEAKTTTIELVVKGLQAAKTDAGRLLPKAGQLDPITRLPEQDVAVLSKKTVSYAGMEVLTQTFREKQLRRLLDSIAGDGDVLDGLMVDAMCIGMAQFDERKATKTPGAAQWSDYLSGSVAEWLTEKGYVVLRMSLVNRANAFVTAFKLAQTSPEVASTYVRACALRE